MLKSFHAHLMMGEYYSLIEKFTTFTRSLWLRTWESNIKYFKEQNKKNKKL